MKSLLLLLLEWKLLLGKHSKTIAAHRVRWASRLVPAIASVLHLGLSNDTWDHGSAWPLPDDHASPNQWIHKNRHKWAGHCVIAESQWSHGQSNPSQSSYSQCQKCQILTILISNHDFHIHIIFLQVVIYLLLHHSPLFSCVMLPYHKCIWNSHAQAMHSHEMIKMSKGATPAACSAACCSMQHHNTMMVTWRPHLFQLKLNSVLLLP